MSLVFWYLLALGIIIIWTIAVSAIWGRWKARLEKLSIQCMGPFVMWKTQSGKELIERVATKRHKGVLAYGKISVWITGASMVTMTAMLLLSAYLVIIRARDLDIDPHMLLGLPGLNPMIPLWFGILGIVVAMVVHEFSHGLLTILAKVKVVSLGIMFFIFPMGAFVEPDEDAIKKIEKKKRVRMYASGPASNILMAGLFSLIFSVILMSSVTPVANGVGITNVEDGTPAHACGLEPGMIMVSFNNTTLLEYGDFSDAISNAHPNQTVEIRVYEKATGSIRLFNATLVDRMSISEKEDDAGIAYLGINTMTVTDDFYHPLSNSENLSGIARSISIYVTLPLQRLSPVNGAIADFYTIDGFWSFLPENVFWILANSCYWIFWLNLMVGLSNALPAVPLDGGYIFKDWLDTILARNPKYSDEEKRTRAVDKVAITLAFIILFLILWQVIGPRIF